MRTLISWDQIDAMLVTSAKAKEHAMTTTDGAQARANVRMPRIKKLIQLFAQKLHQHALLGVIRRPSTLNMKPEEQNQMVAIILFQNLVKYSFKRNYPLN